MQGPPEILVLDEDVGREEKGARRLDQGRIVADADEDAGPRPAERPPDPRDEPPLAELVEPHGAPP